MSVEFHRLKVAEVRAETDDSVSIEFDVPKDLAETFRHVPGQHVIVPADLDGEDVRRSYSIASPAGADQLCIGIKRIPDGVFSTWATSEIAAGDVLEVMAPIGEFALKAEPSASRHLVMIAAGSGITPVLSMVATTLRDEPDTNVTLIYGNRTTQSIMFHDDIADLKSRYLTRLQVVHVLSRETHEVPLFQGRIDADKITLLTNGLIDSTGVDGWYLCGPLDMVETITDQLVELGVHAGAVHSELFFDERIDVVASEPSQAEGTVQVQVRIDGRTSVVAVDPNGAPLLDYARAVRAGVPFACKGGMCATCKAVVVEGLVTMTKNYALTTEEIDAGFVLTCQAHPVGDGPFTISYDVHGGVGR